MKKDKVTIIKHWRDFFKLTLLQKINSRIAMSEFMTFVHEASEMEQREYFKTLNIRLERKMAQMTPEQRRKFETRVELLREEIDNEVGLIDAGKPRPLIKKNKM